MEITWAGRWNAAEEEEDSVMRDIGSIEAWARVSSDAIKELKALWFNLPESNALLFFI
jgi:hypothetical protein